MERFSHERPARVAVVPDGDGGARLGHLVRRVAAARADRAGGRAGCGPGPSPCAGRGRSSSTSRSSARCSADGRRGRSRSPSCATRGLETLALAALLGARQDLPSLNLADHIAHAEGVAGPDAYARRGGCGIRSACRRARGAGLRASRHAPGLDAATRARETRGSRAARRITRALPARLRPGACTPAP